MGVWLLFGWCFFRFMWVVLKGCMICRMDWYIGLIIVCFVVGRVIRNRKVDICCEDYWLYLVNFLWIELLVLFFFREWFVEMGFVFVFLSDCFVVGYCLFIFCWMIY